MRRQAIRILGKGGNHVSTSPTSEKGRGGHSHFPHRVKRAIREMEKAAPEILFYNLEEKKTLKGGAEITLGAMRFRG